jgi:hypothetical protein
MFCSGNFWSGVKNKSSDGAIIKTVGFKTDALNNAATLAAFQDKALAHLRARRLSNMATV